MAGKAVPNPLPCRPELAREFKRCHGNSLCCNCDEGEPCWWGEDD